ncbi:MAG: class I SAM-dependent methyltransferase [Microthrixaceae bacterium]
MSNPSEVFTRIYERNLWNGGSGVGSHPSQTAAYREVVERLVSCPEIASVVDVGCGDWQVGSLIDWTGVHYVGLDVVYGLVMDNQRRHHSDHVEFGVADARAPYLPPADLLLIKDVLQHWPTADVRQFLARNVDRYPYLLVTNDVASEAHPTAVNTNIPLGGWRCIDLAAPPFNVEVAWSTEYPVRDGHWTKQVCLLTSKGIPWEH